MLRGWETTLRKAFRGRPKFVTDVRVHFDKRDGHISAELAIDGVSKRVAIDRLLFELGMAMQGSAVDGAWISVGFTFPPQTKVEDFEMYRRAKGALSFRTHSRRFTKAVVPYLVQEARRLHEIFRKEHKYRANVIFVRVWWYPDGRRPFKKKAKGKRKR